MQSVVQKLNTLASVTIQSMLSNVSDPLGILAQHIQELTAAYQEGRNALMNASQVQSGYSTTIAACNTNIETYGKFAHNNAGSNDAAAANFITLQMDQERKRDETQGYLNEQTKLVEQLDAANQDVQAKIRELTALYDRMKVISDVTAQYSLLSQAAQEEKTAREAQESLLHGQDVAAAKLEVQGIPVPGQQTVNPEVASRLAALKQAKGVK